MKKLKIIQVGSGGWGKSWLQFLHESDDWQLAGLVSRGGANLTEAQAKWGIPGEKCFADLDDALSLEADAVLVTVPHHLHVPVSKKALEAGKHVLCEKPFSDSLAEAMELVAFAKTTSKQLAISQNFRYRQGLWQMKAASGDVGPVDSLTIDIYQPQPEQISGWRRQTVSTLLLEIAIHHLDMARFLLDANATSVFCRAWNPPWSCATGPASASLIVEFENGVNMSFNGSWAARGKYTPWDGVWRVQYERGAATWDGALPKFEVIGGSAYAPAEIRGYPGTDREGILKAFANSIRQNARFPTDGEDNLQSLAIVFAAIQSFQEERKVLIDEIMAR